MMPELQATWTPEGRLFFWSLGDSILDAVDREAPALTKLGQAGQTTRRNIAFPGDPPRRKKTIGFEAPVKAALPVLSALAADEELSDSLRCWSYAAKFALELAVGQRVVPAVYGGHAHWSALLSRQADRERFQALVDALPLACRALPTRDRGSIRLPTAHHAARAFLDAAIDGLYRQDAYPGTARGWALEFAQALKDDRETQFRPRDARYQGIPDMIVGWTTEAEAGGLRLGVSLELPDASRQAFSLSYWLHPPGGTGSRIPLAQAWKAGKSIAIDGVVYPHPATSAITGLARMARVYEPLNTSLQGKAPRDLRWMAQQAWDFLAVGAPLLRDAGFEVIIPSDFEKSGRHRIRARMRVDAMDDGAELDLAGLLRFHWEVVLGDIVLSGPEFTELLEKKSPVVEFQGVWVLLDPAELAKLPAGLPREGTLPAAVALRAVLTGMHEGVEVVAHGRLELIIEALRNPPKVPPPAALHGTLRPYQVDGLSWLATLGDLGLGALLADDMGLGKTIQLIAHLLRRKDTAERARRKRHPSLVVCPTSVLGNWKRELARFGPSLKVVRYHGMNRDPRALDGADVVITTYGLLVRDREVLAERQWDVVALDEAQAIKNPESQRARAARDLKGRHRVAMTGTPVENRLDELWSLLQFLVPGLLGPRATFRRNVAVPVERFGDQEIAHRLKLGVAPFLLRRLKSDPTIIDDLPEKLESNDYSALKPEQASLYRDVVAEYMDEIGRSDEMKRRGQVLAMLTALKQVCNHPAHYLKEGGSAVLSGRSGKLERLTELVEDILELGEAALVFTQYREMGDLLQRHFLEAFEEQIPFLHGGVTPEKRDAMVEDFQSGGGPPVLIVSLKAGGTGLNLTRASHVIHYDRWWNPAVEDQATDRAYRIGQRRNVQVHKMVCQGTLEERIDAMLQDKRALAKSVIGGGEAWVTELDDDALRALVMLGEDAVEEAE
jgi:hypothetical protein